MNKIIDFSIIGALGLISLSVHAETRESKPNCEITTTTRLGKCQFPEVNIAEPIQFLGRDISTKFVITYDFECKGHQVNLSFGSIQGRSPVVMGSANEMLSVVSSQRVSITDESPENTRVKSFKPGCLLRVLTQSSYPSKDAINNFGVEAKYLNDLIMKDMNLVLLSENLSEMNELNQEQYERLKEMVWDYLTFAVEDAEIDGGIEKFSSKPYELLSIAEMEANEILTDWEDLLFDNEAISDLVSVLNFAKQNLDAHSPIPSPLDSELVLSTSSELKKHYNSELRRSLRKAKRFLREINKFIHMMEGENAEIVKNLKAKITN